MTRGVETVGLSYRHTTKDSDVLLLESIKSSEFRGER